MDVRSIDEASRVFSIAGYEPVSQKHNSSINNWASQPIINRANPRDFARLFPYHAVLLAFSEASREIWRSSQVAEREFQRHQEPIRRQQIQRESLRKSSARPPIAFVRHSVVEAHLRFDPLLTHPLWIRA